MSEVLVEWTHGDGGRATADALLTRVAASRFGVPETGVSVTRHCPRCGSAAHGRPVVLVASRAPVPASISYTAGVVAVALATTGQVGVDVEALDGRRHEGLADLLLHPEEAAGDPRALALTWVRKEALVKATGEGLVTPLTGIRVTAPDEPAGLVSWHHDGTVTMLDLELGAHHLGCVAVVADRGVEVSVRTAGPAAAPGAATP